MKARWSMDTNHDDSDTTTRRDASVNASNGSDVTVTSLVMLCIEEVVVSLGRVVGGSSRKFSNFKNTP